MTVLTDGTSGARARISQTCDLVRAESFGARIAHNLSCELLVRRTRAVVSVKEREKSQ